MKKTLISILISVLAITSCDDIQDNIIDPSTESFNVIDVNSPTFVTYSDENVVLRIGITFDRSESIQEVWFKIRLKDGSLTIAPRINMKDNGNIQNYNDLRANDNSFNGIFEMSLENPNGSYAVEIFIRTVDDLSRKIAVNNFDYINIRDNFAPVISNLSAPDTVVVEDPRSLIRLTLKADDQNGQQDIKSVYFITTRPDGTSNGIKIFLRDSGNLAEDGDESAGDGIYSIIIQVTPENQKGEYIFEFEAGDRAGASSNKLSHSIVLL